MDRDDAGITIRQAAAVLQVTPQTVRRRLHLGDLAGWTVQGKYGPEWRVALGKDRPALAACSRGDLVMLIAWQHAVINDLRHGLGLLLQDLLREAPAPDRGAASDCLVGVPVVARGEN